MDNQGMPLINGAHYQDWKEMLKFRLLALRSNICHLVCNCFTKTPRSCQELQKKFHTLN